MLQVEWPYPHNRRLGRELGLCQALGTLEHYRYLGWLCMLIPPYSTHQQEREVLFHAEREPIAWASKLISLLFTKCCSTLREPIAWASKLISLFAPSVCLCHLRLQEGRAALAAEPGHVPGRHHLRWNGLLCGAPQNLYPKTLIAPEGHVLRGHYLQVLACFHGVPPI